MSALEALDGPWSKIYTRMAADIQGQGHEAAGEDLPLPTVPGAFVTPVEAYARAVPDMSLKLSLPVALAAYSVAGQGAYWMNLPLRGGAKLEVPMIFQSTVIAPSGYGKSTVLNPLVKILDQLNYRGIVARKKIATELADAVIMKLSDDGMSSAGEEEKVRKIYSHGACKRLTLDSGTPEGVRSALVSGGSMAGIMTAEPDILREISGYAKDGGTYRYLLDGWGGDKISVVRAEKSMLIPRCCLPYCIVVQPIAFEQFNKSARGNEDQGVSSDSAVGRGLYGRSWMLRVGWDAKPKEAFGLVSDHGLEMGQVSDLMQAQIMLGDRMEELARRADEYRARMGITIGWEEAAMTDLEGLVPHPDLPAPVWLTLAPDALMDYACIHNLRLALIDLVSELELQAPGTDRLFMPMVSRLVQHIMRLAMELQLAFDPQSSEVEKWAVRDAGSRIVPWLFGEWCREMKAYAEAATVAMAEAEIKKNPRGIDLTPEGSMVRAIHKLRADLNADLDADDHTFRKADVVDRALSWHPSSSRPELRGKFNEAFDRMVEQKWLEEIKLLPPVGSKGGRPRLTYKATVVGKLNGI